MSKNTFVPSSANVAFANTAIAALEAISTQRELWEKTTFKTANETLYALLADTLGIYNQRFVNADKADMRVLRIELTAKLKAANVRVVKSTTTLAMLVRFVFMSDRKRALRYAYVLQAAVIDGIAADGLAAYIDNAGGIEEIVKKVQRKPETVKKHAALELAKEQVNETVAFNYEHVTDSLPYKATGTLAVLLVRPNADGTVSVVGSLDDISEGMLNSITMAMAKVQAGNNEVDAANDAEQANNNSKRS